ncbi:polymorphic toxin type 8 domain-containing protein [Ethanoligenens sp.]|uniref:polymorphic toxin type 8 domain-containing protein n=1 Tax=Ethanoligenens sp. TaxID=2099655 RepID=UPI0039EB77EF
MGKHGASRFEEETYHAGFKNPRGEIKRDINQIKRGKRKSIRVSKGYNLAHRRGYEARKGYGYKYSDLQNVDLHRLQYKHEGYGR